MTDQTGQNEVIKTGFSGKIIVKRTLNALGGLLWQIRFIVNFVDMIITQSQA
jgi:hypothetical protein